jgi:ABC-type antimicrobial peptide transport system permease subunit
MEQRLDAQTLRSRLAVRLMIGFALVALALALVGVYGVMSYAVSTRAREIGIRRALGATKGAAVWLILRQAAWPVVGGIVVGLAAVGILQRFVRSLLYGVSPSDPLILAGAAAAILVVGLLASLVPALRTTRIEPVSALKTE